MRNADGWAGSVGPDAGGLIAADSAGDQAVTRRALSSGLLMGDNAAMNMLSPRKAYRVPPAIIGHAV